MFLIPQQPDRYLRCPHVEPTSDGGAMLSVIAWYTGSDSTGSAMASAEARSADRECVLRFAVSPEGAVVGDPVATHEGETLMGFRLSERAMPFDDSAEEQRASAGGWQVAVEQEGALCRVVVSIPTGAREVVWEARGIAASPAVACGSGGAWVAFHHNVREDTGQADVAKWIALRFVDLQGRVFEPAAPMTDRDRDLSGEEQGFEFPTLVVGADGAVDLFGRGSHNVYRQRLSSSGFSSREPFDDGSWGCRGRRIAASKLVDGQTLTARRIRQGIELRLFDGPSGGAPQLVSAVVQIENHPTVSSVGAPPAADKAPAASKTSSAGKAPATDKAPAASKTSSAGKAPATDKARAAGKISSADKVGAADKAPVGWRGPRILFGDIQQHSAHSDGVGTADEAYLRGRYQYGDDFAALTDHESFLGKRTGPGEWAYLQSVAERHNAPGKFATIVAYEWTGKMFPGPGHKCVYLPGPGAPIVSRDEVQDGATLVQRIKAQGAVTGPHHIGWTGADEPGHDAVGQPVWEICSCHGAYETPDNPLGYRGDLHDQFAKPMLDKGLRFGFMANSDSHGLLWHHGECRKRDPFRTGLTAVLAETCTREAVLSAIRARRCYATSGAKILLDFCAGDAPMGSAVPGTVEVQAVAQGTAELASIELVGPPGVVARGIVNGRHGSLRATRAAPYLYVRVTQQDGEQAWSSPIFFGA